jgi:basic amino acid/polyamine antiporter, APA family
MSTAHDASSTGLPRVLGLWDAVALVVGGIIGSGVFFKASVLSRELGSFGPILALWVLLGLHTLFATLSLAELAGMLPHAGGPYVYLQAAYGRPVAFLWGWGEFWIIRTASLGALSTASVIAFSELVPLDRWWQMFASVGLVTGLSAINLVATRGGAWVQNVTTVLKVAFLLVLIAAPLFVARSGLANLEPIWPERMDGAFWSAFGIGAIAVLWPYDGWINVAPVTEEVRDPARNIPRALIIGVGLVIVIYVLVNTSYHLLMPLGAIGKSEAVAAEAAASMFGDWGRRLAAAGIMVSTLGATNGNLLCGPRIYFAMARDGVLPSAFARVHETWRTPANAILLQAAWTTILIIGAFVWRSGPDDKPIDAFDDLTAFAIFGGLLFYSLVVAAVIVLRKKRPDLPRPYRTWGYPYTPLVYLGGSAAVLVAMLLDYWRQTAIGTVLIVAGMVYYAVVARKRPVG